MGDYVDMVEFYTKDNVFYLPKEARWSTIQKQAKQDDIAVKIDTALHTVEKMNPSLKGALPDNYFSRLSLDVSKLAALIDTINNINTVANEGPVHDKKPSEEDLVGRVYGYFLSTHSDVRDVCHIFLMWTLRSRVCGLFRKSPKRQR